MTTAKPAHKRILLKLSGEALMGDDQFGINRDTIVRMVDPVKLLDRAEHLASVQGFFAEHEIPQGAKTLAQILERQRVNAAVRGRESERLSNSL